MPDFTSDPSAYLNQAIDAARSNGTTAVWLAGALMLLVGFVIYKD